MSTKVGQNSTDLEALLAKAENLAEAFPDTGGDLYGEIRMNGHPIKGLNAPTANDHATNMGFVNQQVKNAAPRNLLDNSDFSNPVNQRGNTVYSSSGSKYTIDRWRTHAGVDVLDGCIRFRVLGDSSAQYLYQYFEVGTIKPGEIYTGACMLKDGTICVGSGVAVDGENAVLYSSQDNAFNIRIFANYSDTDRFAICHDIAGGTADIVWAALYKGAYTIDSLPEYQPKGYSAELLECQKYFRKVINGNGYVSKSNAYIFIPDAMRVTPTVTVTKLGSVRANGEEVNPSSVDSVTMYKDSIRLTIAGTFSASNHAAMLFNAEIELSADL